MSDEEVRNHLEKIKEKRENAPENYGRDGSIVVYFDSFEYRGISFRIRVSRYFTISPVNIDAEMSDGTSKSAEIQPTEKSSEVSAFLRKHSLKTGFLQYHTTHSWNEGMSLKERFQECLDEAKKDIDWFRDEGEQEIEEKISSMREEFDQLEV